MIGDPTGVKFSRLTFIGTFRPTSDAAHIPQFAGSCNNALTNGIARSKNAHWLERQHLEWHRKHRFLGG